MLGWGIGACVGAALDRIVPRQMLEGDPPQLGELRQPPLDAEAAPAPRLETVQRHLRLVVRGGVLHVADPALDALGEFARRRHVLREDRGRQAGISSAAGPQPPRREIG